MALMTFHFFIVILRKQTTGNMKRVLIIGAGGFIGGHIAEESLKRGYDTWCGVRPSTSRRFLGSLTVDFR
jgi:nucleoside-diphosphate-sugar epimerase